MTDRRRKMTAEEIMAVIEQSSPGDYDGAIDWHTLSFEQKLRWISASARIWQEWGGVLSRPGPAEAAAVRERKSDYGAKDP